MQKLISIFCICITVWLSQAVAGSSEPWFKRCLVGMEVGPTGAQFAHSDTNDTRYCARFDGGEVVRQCVAANCEYLVIWARDGDYAYYDSKLLPKAPGLGKRDVMRESVEEARKHKLPIIAYCVVQQNGHFLDAHPEWAMRDASSNRIDRFCYNSGYLEAMKQIVAEQLAYGIDGFHIDMLDQGFGPPYGCWCDACRKQFEAEFGCGLPAGVTWDETWDKMLEFRYRTSERFEKALYAHIKSLNPGVSVDYNYHGNPPFSWEAGQRPVQHAGNSDFVTGETGMWGFSAATVGLNAEFYRASTPGVPFQIAISRDARCYHNQTVRPLPDLEWEMFTLLAHGCFVTVIDKMGFEGWLDPVCYERVGAAFKKARAKRESFAGEPVQEVGIYFSSRTRDWFGKEKPENYFQPFQGAQKAMLYEHITWGIVLDENATLATLKKFPILLLPNAAILFEKEVEMFKQYVQGGGRLILTGLSGCYDDRGNWQGKSSLESLTGARPIQKLDSLDNWVLFPSSSTTKISSQIQPDGRADWPFLVKGPAVVFEATSGTAFGQLLKPYRTIRQQQGKEGFSWPLNADSPVGPAFIVNHVGEGMVLSFTVSPDFATASEHHIPEARALLRNAIRFLNPKPRVTVTAPKTVEAVVTEDRAKRQLKVHLIGYNTPPQTIPAERRPYVLPALIEDAPMYQVEILSDGPIKKASAWNKSTRIHRRENRVEATVNDIHEVLVLGY